MRSSTRGRLPWHGWLGLALVVVAWALNWSLDGLRTHWLFFALWLGYGLAVDGLCVLRRGTSLFTRSRRAYAGLFLISIPVWWLFEAVNLRLRNWHYLGREYFSDLEYVLLASLDFSTVVPAVLGTAELFAGFEFVRRLAAGPHWPRGSRPARAWLGLGLAMVILMLAWPMYFFPCVWLSFYFLIESANLKLGHRCLVDWTRRGDWRPILALALGALTCGFFWELWNALSYPKWVYTVPLLGFFKVFEMPLLGYLGYVPFAFELFAAVHLVYGLFGRGRSDYITRGIAPS